VSRDPVDLGCDAMGEETPRPAGGTSQGTVLLTLYPKGKDTYSYYTIKEKDTN
jgi:hypothetical protein